MISWGTAFERLCSISFLSQNVPSATWTSTRSSLRLAAVRDRSTGWLNESNLGSLRLELEWFSARRLEEDLVRDLVGEDETPCTSFCLTALTFLALSSREFICSCKGAGPLKSCTLYYFAGDFRCTFAGEFDFDLLRLLPLLSRSIVYFQLEYFIE